MDSITSHNIFSKKEALELILERFTNLTDHEVVQLQNDLINDLAEEYDQLNLERMIEAELGITVTVRSVECDIVEGLPVQFSVAPMEAGE